MMLKNSDYSSLHCPFCCQFIVLYIYKFGLTRSYRYYMACFYFFVKIFPKTAANSGLGIIKISTNFLIAFKGILSHQNLFFTSGNFKLLLACIFSRLTAQHKNNLEENGNIICDTRDGKLVTEIDDELREI